MDLTIEIFDMFGDEIRFPNRVNLVLFPFVDLICTFNGKSEEKY